MNVTYLLYLPEIDYCRNAKKCAADQTDLTLSTMAYNHRGASEDLDYLASAVGWHDLKVSGNEYCLFVTGPEETLKEFRFEHSQFVPAESDTEPEEVP